MINTSRKIIISIIFLAFSFFLFTPAQAATLTELQNQLNNLLTQISQLKSQLSSSQQTTTNISGCTITSFTSNLYLGLRGNEVKCLQIILNSDPDTRLALTGAGSPGNETIYYWQRTKAAVTKFQQKYAKELKITKPTSIVGQKTRTKLNELLKKLRTSCKCTNWTNSSCGTGGCSIDKLLQTRTCTPVSCATTSRCTTDSSCTSGGGTGGGGTGGGGTSGGGGTGGGTTIHTCSDDTPYNQCSSDRPKYCSNTGSLSNNCYFCGCPAGQTCQADGSCITPSAPANQAPVLTSVGSKTITVSTLLTFTLSAYDPDGSTITYSVTNLPSGSSFDTNTHVFVWTPGSVANYANICFTVSDGSLTDSECININVIAASCTNCGLSSPTLFSTSPTALSPFTISCPTNAVGYDCINAYADTDSNQCTFSSYSGTKAVFNCTVPSAGAYTAKCKSNINTGSNCCASEQTKSYTVSAAPTLTCADGTPLNQCSTNKPQYCDNNANLSDNCSVCGCSGTLTCQVNGSCGGSPSTTTIDYNADYYVAAPDSSEADKAKANIIWTSAQTVRLQIGRWGAGKDILFFAGTYNFGDGAGMAFPYADTTLRGVGDNTVFRWSGNAGQYFFYTERDNCKLADMRLNGGGLSSTGIYLTANNGLEISGLTIENLNGMGIFLNRHITGAQIHNIKMDHTKIGIYINGGNDNVKIYDFQLTNQQLWGMIMDTTGTNELSTNFDIYDFVIDMGSPWEKAGQTAVLTQAVSAGNTTLTVNNTSNFSPTNGQDVAILRIGSGETLEYREFSITDGTHLAAGGAQASFAYNHPVGTEVVQVWRSEHGIYLQGSNHKIHDGEIRNAVGGGIRSKAEGAYELGNHEIYNMYIHDCMNGGMGFATPGDHHDLKIYNNTLINNASPRSWYGSYIHRAPGIILSVDQGQPSDQNEKHHVYGNTVTMKSELLMGPRYAIKVFGPGRCTIENNTINGSGASNEVGIYIQETGEGAAQANIVRNNIFNNVATHIIDDGNGTITDASTLFCSDGTIYGQCSATRPQYCSNGLLINNCSACGCSTGVCQIDGSCAIVPYLLTITNNGGGEVTSNPSGISCGSTCSASFNSGTSVTLTAAPSSGYIFSGWTGDCSGVGACAMTMNSVKSVTAVFQSIPRVSTELVGSWNFNDTSGGIAADGSSYGNNGTVSGATVSVGVVGNALSFDGVNDYVQVADNNSLSFGNSSQDSPFTVLAWVNVDDSANTNKMIVSKWAAIGGTQKEFMFYRRGEYGIRQITATLYDFSTGAYAYRNSDTVALSGWQFVVIAYDGRGGATAANGITMYLNGNVLSSTAYNDASYVAMENGNLPLRIGQDSQGYMPFDGFIDEVRIYKGVLTQSEIQQYYTTEKP